MNARIDSTPARPAARLLAAVLLAFSTLASAQTVQEHVHGHGHEVMPFDLSKTTHVFRMTEDGGTQKVVMRVDSGDAEQVHMIQHHLMMEAAEFQKGNFADPARLHGEAMPGLREMQAGAPRMQITYRPLPDGAEIRFHAKDIAQITAIHRWFGAQLSEHGTDARAE
jgi:hypothetical protein